MSMMSIENNSKLNWDFYQRYNPFEFWKYYSTIMYQYNSENIRNILKNEYIYRDLEKDVVKDVANWLTPQNCLVFVLCSSFEDTQESEYETEQWYGTKYIKSRWNFNMLL